MQLMDSVPSVKKTRLGLGRPMSTADVFLSRMQRDDEGGIRCIFDDVAINKPSSSLLPSFTVHGVTETILGGNARLKTTK